MKGGIGHWILLMYHGQYGSLTNQSKFFFTFIPISENKMRSCVWQCFTICTGLCQRELFNSLLFGLEYRSFHGEESEHIPWTYEGLCGTQGNVQVNLLSTTIFLLQSIYYGNKEPIKKGEKQRWRHLIKHFKKWNEWYRVSGETRG